MVPRTCCLPRESAVSHEYLLLTPASLISRPARRIPEIPCRGLLYHNRFPFLLPLPCISTVTWLSSSLKVCGGGVHTFHNVLPSPSSDCAKESYTLHRSTPPICTYLLFPGFIKAFSSNRISATSRSGDDLAKGSLCKCAQ
jgi:hypothetical protein